jgi:hypothetical protein
MLTYVREIPDSCFVPGERQRVIGAFERSAADSPVDEMGPTELVDLLATLEVGRIAFVLDEFDRVTDPRVRNQIATFMKLLSDACLPVQLIIVGISRDLHSLLGEHPSLRRHLIPISIGRIDTAAVRRMIATGAQRAGISFTEDSIDLIASVAQGSPYHVRLFCAHACFHALKNGTECVAIDAAVAGIASAAQDWAQMSPQDAATFEWALDGPQAVRSALSHVARFAAQNDEIDLPHLRQTLGDQLDNVVGLLRGVLGPSGDSADHLVFRDSLAPQFLLALAMMHPEPGPAERQDEPLPKIVSIVEPIRKAHHH